VDLAVSAPFVGAGSAEEEPGVFLNDDDNFIQKIPRVMRFAYD
jgi:hypothetical protein